MMKNAPTKAQYAVIFISELKENIEGYAEEAAKMEALVKQQKGFVGMESVRDVKGITVSYWESLDAIKEWKMQEAHAQARSKGTNSFYKNYKVQVCKIERAYEFGM